MARLRLVKKKQRRWAPLTAAIGIFAVLCGLLLLVSGPAFTCGDQRRAIARQVRSALDAAPLVHADRDAWRAATCGGSDGSKRLRRPGSVRPLCR